MFGSKQKATALALAASAALALASASLAPAKATPERQISLMETLAEWKYPDSTLLGGASMSDGGNPEIQDLTCQAALATPDPFEDVVRFYKQKAEEVPEVPANARAFVIQDDSKGRPVRVRIIAVHKFDRTDTLVISRGEQEKLTHIAWTQYRRFDPPRAR